MALYDSHWVTTEYHSAEETTTRSYYRSAVHAIKAHERMRQHILDTAPANVRLIEQPGLEGGLLTAAIFPPTTQENARIITWHTYRGSLADAPTILIGRLMERGTMKYKVVQRRPGPGLRVEWFLAEVPYLGIHPKSGHNAGLMLTQLALQSQRVRSFEDNGERHYFIRASEIAEQLTAGFGPPPPPQPKPEPEPEPPSLERIIFDN